jgi:HAD superfamily hydrolase (TIGR01509 family)
MPAYKAFIFDMNGTMINDMHFHEAAWYEMLVNNLHANISRAEIKQQMYGKNEELFDRVFGPGKFTQQQIDAIVLEKETRYQKDFFPYLKLIQGLDAFLAKAKADNIKMAIGTAAITLNVNYVLDNLQIRNYFDVIVTAGDVAVSKPHPGVFLMAAEKLGIPPAACLVFEDAPKGIEAARRAGMKAVGITTYHTLAQLHGDNVLYVVNDYTDRLLSLLFE